ncbi:hypothetical protein FF38_08910 [Lucilia cuprina]|uniref:Uncharacterized protein n=1 Tax=Lucilia cuprina TaxID=7375 RepID=A0A0L0CFK1_LUCCU|nr:hypothetical protein FF38_08910 [Lucilia cuprina]
MDETKYSREHYNMNNVNGNQNYDTQTSGNYDNYQDDQYGHLFNNKFAPNTDGTFSNDFNLEHNSANPMKIESVDELPTSFYLSNEDKLFFDQSEKSYDNMGPHINLSLEPWAENAAVSWRKDREQYNKLVAEEVEASRKNIPAGFIMPEATSKAYVPSQTESKEDIVDDDFWYESNNSEDEDMFSDE